jgi:predicted RNase H-like nuclease
LSTTARTGGWRATGSRSPINSGPAGQAAPDDILDAAAVAWTAHRVATGTAHSHPDPPEKTERGELVAIWF